MTTIDESEMAPKPSTFGTIFYSSEGAGRLEIPDYQRAYSWENKQIGLFIGDLAHHESSGTTYYFGHFIAERSENAWELVDGQQRVTTFVLFLMVCRHLAPSNEHEVPYSLIERFRTVTYDASVLGSIIRRMDALLEVVAEFDSKHPSWWAKVRGALDLHEELSRSQRRMVEAAIQFHRAFTSPRWELNVERISRYIEVVMTSFCSLHLTDDKSVAVNIFEMHNTRGVPLTTLEVVKAKLMKFVYDHGRTGEERARQVGEIQAEFGEIYRMEESLAESGFRGEMTMDRLLHLHLRVVDDGLKTEASQLDLPRLNANSEALVSYVGERLRFLHDGKTERDAEDGVGYAMRLAHELRKSVRIVTEHLPAWDQTDPLVGDVMILERDLSCEFFLVACRRLESVPDQAEGRLNGSTLAKWERFLFTRDFHEAYYRLQYRDDFPRLFWALEPNEEQIATSLEQYLEDGFRSQTSGLQELVASYLRENESNMLKNAFYWWKPKMIYALYKYEVQQKADIREVMRGALSVEHILPQQWQWEWADGWDKDAGLPDDQKKALQSEVDAVLNGLGNLLLLSQGENTSVGNTHPAKKHYRSKGGSYEEHDSLRDCWEASSNWRRIIEDRGTKIFNFIIEEMVGGAVSESGASDA